MTTEEEILIDTCIGSDGADYDVATIAYNKLGILPESTFRMKLSTDICRLFLRRCMYWCERSRNSNEDSERDCYDMKSRKLMDISIKLKMNNYKNRIVKEYNEIVKYHASQTQQPH